MPKFRSTTYRDDISRMGPPLEFASADGCRSVRHFFVDGRKRYQARMDFLGYSEYMEGQKNAADELCNYIKRVPPMPYLTDEEDKLGASKEYAQSMVRSEGVVLPQGNDALDVPLYDEVRMEVDFRSLNYTVLDDASQLMKATAGPLIGKPDDGLLRRYIQRFRRPAGRTVTVPHGMLAYNFMPPMPIPVGVPIHEVREEITFCQKQVPLGAVPFRAYNTQLGTINNMVFDQERYNIPATTLLFVNADVKEVVMPNRHIAYDCYLKFLFAPNISLVAGTPTGWNFFLGRAPGSNNIDYHLVVSARFVAGAWVTGNSPFRSTDFSALFRPDQP